MERQLTLELARITEAAALAASHWVGRGMKNEADDAATTVMRHEFQYIPVQGTVVIGEGEMDEAPMLYLGEKLGSGEGPPVDIAVDPVEGTELVANGLNGAMAVVAIAPAGQLLHAPDMYMQKLAVGPALKGIVDLDDPLSITVRKAAERLGKRVTDLTVAILDRERHQQEIQELREAGVRLKLLGAGDVAAAIATAFPESGIDLYVGSGGAPEGVLAAAALRCLGGDIQGRLMPGDDNELQRCYAMGMKDPLCRLTTVDMVGDKDVLFAATGITPGDVIQGVRMLPGGRAETHSIVLRAKTGTVRFVQTSHLLPRKSSLAHQLTDPHAS
ncbi:class II fructose-bisphosphatase [Paenibacillus marinisediminis]